VQFSWVSAAEGGRFVDIIGKVTAEIKEVGPIKKFSKWQKETDYIKEALK
jgi:coenzyme F420-reducing hydrogenase delta subunit